MTFGLDCAAHLAACVADANIASGPPARSARWLRSPDLINQLGGGLVEIESSLPNFEFLISEHLIDLAFRRGGSVVKMLKLMARASAMSGRRNKLIPP